MNVKILNKINILVNICILVISWLLLLMYNIELMEF